MYVSLGYISIKSYQYLLIRFSFFIGFYLNLEQSITFPQSLYWDKNTSFGMLKYILRWMFVFFLNPIKSFRINFIYVLYFNRYIKLIILSLLEAYYMYISFVWKYFTNDLSQEINTHKI